MINFHVPTTQLQELNILHILFHLQSPIFIYLLEKGREGERQREKHQCVVVSQEPPTGDLACNPGMCPDWELNQ